MNMIRAGAAALMLFGAGCAHQVTLDKPERYAVSAPRQEAGVIAIIDAQTLTHKVTISSFMTGIANSWEVVPGDMLKQVADIELPQTFAPDDHEHRRADQFGQILLD